MNCLMSHGACSGRPRSIPSWRLFRCLGTRPRLASSPSVVHSRRSVVVEFVLTRSYTNQLSPASQTWGITIAGVILQNQLKSDLPEAFFAQFPEGVQLDTLYAAITTIPSLPEPLRTEIQDAFADSFSVEIGRAHV